MKSYIELPCYGIRINLSSPDATGHCNGGITSSLKDEIDDDSDQFSAAMSALESFILAAACAGLDVESPAFLEAIETTVDAICNEFGD